MVDVAVFGWLVGTLASGGSVLLLALALGSVAFLAATGMTALERGSEPAWQAVLSRSGRAARLVGLAVFAATLALSLAGLRLHAVSGSLAWMSTGFVALALAAATGASAACAALGAARALSALGLATEHAHTRRLEAARSQVKAAHDQRRGFLEGHDLRSEGEAAEAQLTRMRSALGSLREAHAALERQRVALLAGGRSPASEADAAGAAGSAEVTDPGAPDASSRLEPRAGANTELVAEVTRARAEVAAQIDLGERVLGAAERAAFRLLCSEPLRRLLRRRPREAALGLEQLEQAPVETLAPRLAAASHQLELFLQEILAAKGELTAIASRRRPSLHRDDAEASAPGSDPDDVLVRAREDLDAMEDAYAAVLERAELARVRLDARAGALAVAAAAGVVSSTVDGGHAPHAQLVELVHEVTRAEAAMATVVTRDADVPALVDALARSTSALDRSDAASLEQLCAAFREIG